MRSPTFRKDIGIGGLLIALLPPLGWLMALGYRKEVAFRLMDGRAEEAPGWKNWFTYLVDGMRAAGVIVAYYSPFMLAYWMLALDSPAQALEHWQEILLFVAGIPLFLPVLLPVVPFLYPSWFPWINFTTAEAVFLILLFVSIAFILPAAFLQVSLHRRFRAALSLPAALRLIRDNPRLYMEAWAISLLVTAVGTVSTLLSPWLLFWSYLVIGIAFNNALALSRLQKYNHVYKRCTLLAPAPATTAA